MGRALAFAYCSLLHPSMALAGFSTTLREGCIPFRSIFSFAVIVITGSVLFLIIWGVHATSKQPDESSLRHYSFVNGSLSVAVGSALGSLSLAVLGAENSDPVMWYLATVGFLWILSSTPTHLGSFLEMLDRKERSS